MTASPPPGTLRERTDALARQLVHLGFRGLFVDGGADALWRTTDSDRLLGAIVGDGDRDWLSRFLASEVLFQCQFTDLPSTHFDALAAVYVDALKANASGFIADWGLLSGPEDTGRLGGRFVFFGVPATPVLLALLDDHREVPYIEPPAFPSGIRLGVERRDFAALYLRHIHRLAIIDGGREANIHRIREALR